MTRRLASREAKVLAAMEARSFGRGTLGLENLGNRAASALGDALRGKIDQLHASGDAMRRARPPPRFTKAIVSAGCSDRLPSRLIALLCITVWSSTFAVGAFPALLADIDRAVGLSDREVGAVAGIFGFVRMLADIPVGLFISRHLRWALALGPLLLAAGVLCLSAADSLSMLLLGRGIMGVAQAFGMIGLLTTILRYQERRRLGAALNAFELSAMIGVLGGVTVISSLPTWMPWTRALLVACIPQLAGIMLIPAVIRSLPGDPGGLPPTDDARSLSTARPRPPLPGGVVLAFIAAGTIAIAYTTVEQFLLPLRGSREFGLDRVGIARLLMIAQICDIGLLLPFGVLADRFGPARILRLVLAAQAAGLLLTAFGGLSWVWLGVVCYGVGMAGWMLPLGVLRRETEPRDVAWRTAVYRVCVDAGMFLGPFASGLLASHVGLLPATVAALLVLLAVSLRGR